MRKTRCKVCGKKIQYTADRHYVIYHDNEAIGVLSGRTWFDAFDCAYCGSQNIVGVRETGEPISVVDEGVKKQNETD
jgi:DNA-directed RNA polymerase subunit RPC12/RpoP